MYHNANSANIPEIPAIFSYGKSVAKLETPVPIAEFPFPINL